jgi:hypothetical protein
MRWVVACVLAAVAVAGVAVVLAQRGSSAAPLVSCPMVVPPDRSTQQRAPLRGPTPTDTHLSRYEGDLAQPAHMDVLAPRGWTCRGALAEDGNWEMTAESAGHAPTGRVTVEDIWGVQGAGVLCPYFKDERAGSPNPAECELSPDVHVTSRARDAVRFAGTRLVGSMIRYREPNGELDSQRVTCLLPESERAFCDAVLSDAERRLR